MERRPDLGLGSYGRFFPNQDTLPRGGFGNLIALPLQKQPRDIGNSVFLDDQMEPYEDQWSFLSSLKRTGRTAVEDLVRDAERRRRVVGVRMPEVDEEYPEPWTAPPSRRRKDRLLQQNGYFILRFLAEDVGKDLDGVLDSLLHSLAARERSRSDIMRATR
jgi:hypothetical protein